CGVSVPSIPKKRLEHIKGQMVAQIDGMRCESCRRTVTQAINELEGASAKVSLEKQNAIIYYDRDIEKDTVIQAIESKGFIVTDLY
ncbi:MAG: heavy-metal-associated domain-containing protein, partial [Clostridia bacterium]|nr:heavy-metal-associated domain-containing protein [Clostridia bacterium]